MVDRSPSDDLTGFAPQIQPETSTNLKCFAIGEFSLSKRSARAHRRNRSWALTKMFQNRRTSQKPDEELYAAFKQSFPDVGPGTSSASAQQGEALESSSLSEALIDAPSSNRYEPLSLIHVKPSHHPHSSPSHRFNMKPSYSPIERDDDDVLTMDYFGRPFPELDGGKDHDGTPKALSEAWRLTPSIMDPASYTFQHFLNAPPGYYTPTPGGINTLYHNQAGDLHTPGMGMNTPLSMPHSVHALPAHEGHLDMQHFQPHLMHHHSQFQHPYAQPTYAPPHHFLQHQDSGYVAMEGSSHKTTPNENENAMGPPSSAGQVAQAINAFMGMPPNMLSGERFRYHTTLNAPTAMVRHMEEIPVTYLNKGQAYTLSIFDTARPPPSNAGPLKYRTYVRISFEDEQQRAKPGSCWQLWKEGRGTAEAHQRAGKLLAVEYVDPNQGGDDEIRKSPIELEKASFDGFAVTWTASNTHQGAPDCGISVRFNFLSTDFSHSKGVKGIPVRLCAKTELLSTIGDDASQNHPEVCYSKVKLFRDHGAERKLSNDVAHVKKTIDKLKQQISQAEAGLGNMGKRKRSGSMAKGSMNRPGSKLMKHKRTWSMDSDADTSGRMSAEEDLHMKLIGMQDMFSSTRPLSVLFLKGDPEDNPDDFPVVLSGDMTGTDPLTRMATWESRHSNESSPSSNPVSPTPSSISTTTPKRKFSEIQQGSIPEEEEEEHHQSGQMSRPLSPSQAIKVQKRQIGSTPRSSLLALDVDKTYQPPPERPIKPGK